MLLILVLVIAIAAVILELRAARRFEAEQRRLGRWDDKGPLVETAPPHIGQYAPSGGGNMSERLEVVGEYHGEIVNDRRPHPPEQGPAANNRHDETP